MRAFCASVVVVLSLGVTGAYGRVHRYWSYNDLLKESDVIVIGNALKTVTVPSTDKLPEEAGILSIGGSQVSVAVAVRQVETVFHIQAIVKGQVGDKQLTLVHFRWKYDDELKRDGKQHGVGIDNGPAFVAFPIDSWFLDDTSKKVKIVKAGSDCLLYLKLRKDGKYEPLSGQVDPVDSVRWLKSPDPAFPNNDPPQTPAARDHLR